MNPAWENAVKRGDIHTVRGLVGLGMDVNARDRYGQTALCWLRMQVITKLSKP
jgi:ankyrin repeat protein